MSLWKRITRRNRPSAPEVAGPAARCQLCQAAIVGTPACALVPIEQPPEPGAAVLDGRQLVLACSDAHLKTLLTSSASTPAKDR